MSQCDVAHDTFVVVNTFQQFRDEVHNMIDAHVHQQLVSYPELDLNRVKNNALGMAGIDIAASQTLQHNVGMRNDIQQNVGSFESFFDKERISDLRKKKKARVRKSVPLSGNAHMPLNMKTPTKKPVGYDNSRHYRNGLSFNDEINDKNVVTDANKANSSLQQYIREVKKLLLATSNTSPMNPMKAKVYTQIAQKDSLALDIIEVTHSSCGNPEEAKTTLMSIFGVNDN